MTISDQILEEEIPKNSVLQAYIPTIKNCMKRFAYKAVYQLGAEYVDEIEFNAWLNKEVDAN
jgi:hypothetical protein